MHFYFNLAGAVHDPDDEGHELSSISEARIMAVKLASEMLRDRPELAWLGDEFRVEVTDGNQELMFTIITLGVDAAAVETKELDPGPALVGSGRSSDLAASPQSNPFTSSGNA